MQCNLIIDPQDVIGAAYHDSIRGSLGLIPEFVLGTITDLTADPSKDFLEVLAGYYGFPLSEMEGGSVEDDVYLYPEDPELYPLAKYDFGETWLLQFDYGIVAYVEPDKTTVVRMD